MGYWGKMVNCTLKWMTAGLQINEAFFVFFPWLLFSGLVSAAAATSAASCLTWFWTGVVFKTTAFWNSTGRKQLVKAKFINVIVDVEKFYSDSFWMLHSQTQINKMHLKIMTIVSNCIGNLKACLTKPNHMYFNQ